MAEQQPERICLMPRFHFANGPTWKPLASIAVLATAGMVPSGVFGLPAAPSAETARRCLHYSYLVYPYKRPGSVRMSGDRQAYFRDCIAKDGNVPEPTPPAKPQ